MPILNPNESFPIVRVLTDHTDTATHYVQAIIRDAVTDAVLATVNLDDKGNRRFQKVWKVPYDNVFAVGRYVLITTTIYDDSGYATKSGNYQEVGDTYLIQERWNVGKFGNVGGGGGLDYKELRKIVKEELAALELNELEPVDLPVNIDLRPSIDTLTNSVSGGFAELAAKIAAIEIPVPDTPEPVDFSGIESKIAAVIKAIDALPKFKETDLRPLIVALQEELGAIKAAIVSEVQVELAKPKVFSMAGTPDDIQAANKTRHLRGLANKYKV